MQTFFPATYPSQHSSCFCCRCCSRHPEAWWIRFPVIPMAIWSFPICFFHKKRLDINNSQSSLCLPSGNGVEKAEGLHQETVPGSRYWMDIDPPGTDFTLGRFLGWSIADGLPEQQVQYESVRCWVCAGGQASSDISSGFRHFKTFSFSPEVRFLHISHNNPFFGKTWALY